ncbi:MAG TPA: response regulator [Methylomirabilota bacterium]|nr:response regulator [Methylomirabilota bacterium]
MTERRLLVVDDEPEFARLVGDVAAELGYAVRLCTRSTEFFRAYAEFNPTHIVLDVVMPEVEGFEITQWLAKKGARVDLIITTGFNPRYAEMTSEIGNAGGIRAIRTLSKPVRLADLRAALA